MIERLCIIGVGLIGGSLALALKEAGKVGEVVGVDHDRENLHEALRLGIIDRVETDLVEGVLGANLVVFAAPVGAMSNIFKTLQPVWNSEVIYTDTGSTKGDVMASLVEVFGGIPKNFVPGHPIAGAERSGAKSASSDLFKGRRVILTPVASTAAKALQTVEALWHDVGSFVHEMDAAHHDQVLAATSHLPHVLAFVLTAMLGRQDEQREIFQFAAGGFKDFTRIASSDPRMWVDICFANHHEIITLIESYREALGQTADYLRNGNAEPLLKLFQDARAARQRFLDQVEK